MLLKILLYGFIYTLFINTKQNIYILTKLMVDFMKFKFLSITDMSTKINKGNTIMPHAGLYCSRSCTP
jgi:hypothetical protein